MTAASLTTTHRVNFRCTFLRHQFSPQKHSPPRPQVTHRQGDKESVCRRSIPVDDLETDSPMSKYNLLASYVACLSVHWPWSDLVLRYWMTRHFVILDRKQFDSTVGISMPSGAYFKAALFFTCKSPANNDCFSCFWASNVYPEHVGHHPSDQ